MISGLGIDIIEVERIERAINKNEKFLTRNFTENEIKYFNDKGDKITSIAGNFAAKEAVSKAIGTGFRGFNFSDIEVLRDELGRPIVYLYNGADEKAKELGITEFILSISHTHIYAVANCICIKGAI
ncbi:MAG: holo-ACP synthase [Acidaminobacteraceae bacterium]